MSRKCPCGCGGSLDGLRADAKWASGRSCYNRFHRANGRASAHKKRTRTPSREGHGVRIYIAAEDTDEAILAKATKARERQRAAA